MNKHIELEKVLEYLSSRGMLIENQFKYQILDHDTLLSGNIVTVEGFHSFPTAFVLE